MLKLKTRTMLLRQGARIARINHGLGYPRTKLRSSAAAKRHCSIWLGALRRVGLFHPPGGARVRGEP